MKKIFSLLLSIIGWSNIAAAQDGTATIDTGDTTWLLVATAFVMLMTPGLALFYGGMVHRKNVLGTIMQSFVALGIVSVLWVLFGYSLAFSPTVNGFIGGTEWFGLRNVGIEPNPNYAATIPHQLFMIFQMMFAVITPALITGAVAERMKFSSYLIFLVSWLVIVYIPIAHWVWGVGGWIRNLGALDFAGGLVVHISSGVTALVAAMVIGRRRGYGKGSSQPHNLTMTILGASLLWFGWFGFNAGSALTSGGLAVSAFVVTHIAAAASTLSWIMVEWNHRGKPTVLGAISGSVAGLVAITPAAGFVDPMAALAIGLLAGGICYYGITLKTKFGYDDSLDAVGVHGVGGTLGALATGVFANSAVNSAGTNGILYGNNQLILAQLISVGAVVLYVGMASWGILFLIDKLVGLRVSDEHEEAGLDLSQHGETGYVM